MQLLTGLRLWFIDLLGWEDSPVMIKFHLITGFGMVTLILLHIYMNWWWVKAQFKVFK
jgi:cytochrome b subunit of formate dehydrogenase